MFPWLICKSLCTAIIQKSLSSKTHVTLHFDFELTLLKGVRGCQPQNFFLNLHVRIRWRTSWISIHLNSTFICLFVFLTINFVIKPTYLPVTYNYRCVCSPVYINFIKQLQSCGNYWKLCVPVVWPFISVWTVFPLWELCFRCQTFKGTEFSCIPGKIKHVYFYP